jgi:hypothetical protein
MKKFIIALVALITMTVQASAMSYQQAREQALFLTDKMAYELNLTDEQYEAAYEINLDYLMSINNYDDLYGAYWRQRNLDLSYILLDWQYNAYCAASYFYRPLYWRDNYWHFGVYARYPHRDYFFFSRPVVYVDYHGGHSWRMNGGRSWYRDRHFDGPDGPDGRRIGMRDEFDRGDFGRGYSTNNRSFGNGTRLGNNNRPFGGSNSRSTTGNRTFGNGNFGSNSRSTTGNRTFGNGNFGSNANQQPTRQFGGSSQSDRTRSFGNSNSSAPTRSFGTPSSSARTRSFGTPGQSSTRTTVTQPSNSNRSFGGHFSGSTPQRTFTPSNSGTTRSFSAPMRSSSSFGGSTRSFGTSGSGSSSHSSGGHFGGGR